MNNSSHRRLDALAIVGAVGHEKLNTLGYRVTFGLVPAAVVLAGMITGFGLYWVWSTLLSAFVGIAVGCMPNEQRLLWLMSELQGKPDLRSFTITKPLDPPKPYEVVRAGAIQAGQYVVSHDQCQELRDKIRREEEKGAARERSANTMLNARSAQLTHADSVRDPLQSPHDPVRRVLGVISIPTHTVEFEPVVAIRRSREDRLVALGMAVGGKVENPVREADKFYRLSGQGIPSNLLCVDVDAAFALTDLMELTSKVIREDRLVVDLLTRRHSETAVRLAFRAALGIGFIRRERPGFGPGSRLHEFVDLFTPDTSSRCGHEGCRIRRTELGEMWLMLGAQESMDEVFHPRQITIEKAETVIYIDKLENNNFNNDDVREILNRLSGLLENLEARSRETGDSDAVTLAIKTIREAKSQQDLPRSNLRNAIKVILSVGWQLLIGAGGNELFQLLQLLASKL